MSEFVEFSDIDELKDGMMKKVEVGGHEVLLAKVGDSYYSVENRCPHMGGDLSKGTLNGTIVTCPRHHAQFNLLDGNVVRWTDWSGLKLKLARLLKPPRRLKIHEVKVEGDRILIEK